MIRQALIASVVTLLASTAQATSTLQQAQQAFDSLAVDEAAPLFDKALREPATRDERLKAWRGLGLSLAFMGEPRKAQEAFEKLLLTDPAAKVEKALGPKVTRPFEAARRAMRGKRLTLELQRKARTGDVTAKLTDPLGFAAQVVLFIRVQGSGTFEETKLDTSQPVVATTPADKDLAVYAQALDEHGGVILEQGTEEAFNRMPAVVRSTPEAVSSAVEEARKSSGRRTEGEVTEPPVEEPKATSSSWPLYLAGAAAVLGGGAAAAYFMTRPPELTLSPADKTGQLPWRF